MIFRSRFPAPSIPGQHLPGLVLVSVRWASGVPGT